jgi:hypothetical protein
MELLCGEKEKEGGGLEGVRGKKCRGQNSFHFRLSHENPK